MYKQASKLKLRFQTSKGSLSIEQLFDLSLEELDSLAVSLEKEYKASGKKSFLMKKSVKDKALKLRFNIILDILETKLEEVNTLSNANEIKKQNSKIDEIIARKQDLAMENMSIQELEKLRK